MSGANMPGLGRTLLLCAALAGWAGCAPGGPEAPAGAAVPRAPRRPPLSPELRPAAQALEARDFERARALAGAHLAGHPDDAQAAFLIGLSWAWTENYGAARPWLEQALAKAPDFDLAHEPLAHALLMLGELAGARREYEASVALVPDDPKGHYGLGLLELEETRMEAASARFRRALELFDALAARDPRQAAARAGERAECHARLGEVLFARDELDGARRELERATELWPGNISAFYTLSLVYRRLGEDARADAAAARYEGARRDLVERQGSVQR